MANDFRWKVSPDGVIDGLSDSGHHIVCGFPQMLSLLLFRLQLLGGKENEKILLTARLGGAVNSYL